MKYTFLNKESYHFGEYTLVPIRFSDRYEIMNWRNEQVDILRQQQPLTKDEQDLYFTNVVNKLFEQNQPNQILWSVLKTNELIGYGGLVHIDWQNKKAEISFLTKTERAKDLSLFHADWHNYLVILKQIAFGELYFKEIFTYAYDIRPYLYPIIESLGFTETQRIQDHILIMN